MKVGIVEAETMIKSTFVPEGKKYNLKVCGVYAKNKIN